MTRRFALRVHPAGGVLFLLALVFCDSAAVLAVAAALLTHEGAHLLAMALCGVKRCTVELTPFGGMADAECYERLSPCRQAVIALAGVACSAATAWACLRLAPNTPFWYALFCMSASLALINCLPAWPLDGARVLTALAHALGVGEATQRVMQWTACGLSAAFVALGIYGLWLGQVNFSLLLVGPYLAYAAHEGRLTRTVRGMQRAQEAGRKLQGGGVLPLCAYAAAREPGSACMARLLRQSHPQRYQLLLVIDEQNGRICQVLTEQEMAKRLFVSGDGSCAGKAPRRKKMCTYAEEASLS